MRRPESIANLVTIALGIFVVHHSYYALKLGILISPGAGFLPFLCGVALIVLGLVWRFQAFFFKPPVAVRHAADSPAGAGEAAAGGPARSLVKLGLAFAITVAYACLFERIGFFIATIVFMLGWQLVVERERWLKAAVITAVSAGALYTLFRFLLHVELPSNPLFS